MLPGSSNDGSSDDHNGDLDPEGSEANPHQTGETLTLGGVKRRRPSKEDWRKNKNFKLREQGKKYKDWTRKRGQKGRRGTEGDGRRMGPPCKSKACITSNFLHFL